MTQRKLSALLFVFCLFGAACRSAQQAVSVQGEVVHNVFFTLRDDTEPECHALVEACTTSLANLPGITRFAAGVRDLTIASSANDRDFDVSLLVIFKDRAAHDAYLSAKEHVAFVEAHKGNWQTVRVFDSVSSNR